MENQEELNEKDDLINPEQFQVGTAPQEEKESNEEINNVADDGDTTTQNNQEDESANNEPILRRNGDIEDELSEQVEGTFEDQNFGDEELDDDFESFKNQGS